MQRRAAAAEIGYRSQEVCRRAGITYRQLDYWARAGYLEPSIAESSGSGIQRIYSSDDIKKARAMAHLVGLGLTHKALQELINDPRRLQELIDQLETFRAEASLEEMAAV